MKQVLKYFAALFTVFTLMSGVGCASTATQESAGEYLDDSVITTKVKTAILGDAELKVFQINVETYKGAVQLSGFVDSAATAGKAVALTRSVGGVKSVKNDIRIK